MSGNWRDYQEQAAEFFRSLGFVATVGAKIQGVRATHEVDVWVAYERYGLHHKWVVECKRWKSNIPKEKVLALQTLVQDVGADRGFLLSEVGFQPGAVRAARDTNVTLTSLGDLCTNAEAEILETSFGELFRKVADLERRILALEIVVVQGPYDLVATPKPGVDGNDLLRKVGEVAVLDMGLKAGQMGHFPAFYGSENEQPLVAQDPQSLIRGAEAIVDRLASWVERQEQAAQQCEEG